MGMNSRHRLDTITKAWRVTTSSLWRVLVASTNAIRRSVHAVHNLVVIAQPWGILFAVVGVGIAGLSLLIDLDDRLLDRKYRAWTILLQVSSQTTATTRASLTGSNTEDGARSQEIIHGRREGTGTSVRGALELLNRRFDGRWCFDWVQAVSEYTTGNTRRRCILPRQMSESFADFKLPNMILSGAELPEARFHRASLYNASLYDANVRGAMFNFANLKEASFSCADMRGARLYGAELQGARLRHAILIYANMERANLRGARVSFAKLRHVNLEDSVLDGADLGAASMIGAQLDGASMRATALREANLEDSFFGRADVTDADFEDTNLTSADLSEVSGLTESQLRDACADPKRPPKLPIGFSWQPTMCEATAERFQGCPGHEHWKKEYEPL